MFTIFSTVYKEANKAAGKAIQSLVLEFLTPEDLRNAAEKNDLNFVRSYIEYHQPNREEASLSFLLDNPDSHGRNALYLTSKEGHADVVALLLEYHANPNFLLPNGSSALRIAVEKDHAEIVALLLKYGADPTRTYTNTAGKPITVLKIAEQRNNGKIAALINKKLGNAITPDLFELRAARLTHFAPRQIKLSDSSASTSNASSYCS